MEGEASVGFLYPKMWFGSMTSWEGDHFDVLVVCLRGFTHPWWLAGFLPSTVWLKSTKLGGFKYFFIFTPKIAHDFQFDEHISLMGGSTLVQPPTSKHLEQHVGSFAINKKIPTSFHPQGCQRCWSTTHDASMWLVYLYIHLHLP